MVEVPLVFFHHAVQMSIAQDQDMVQALPPHAIQKSFTDRVCLRCSVWCPHHLNPCPYSYPRKGSTILAVIVPNQEARPLSEGRRFPQMLSQPGIGGIPGDTEVHQASGAQLGDDEHEQRSEEEVIGLEKVARPYLAGMASQKGRPGLLGRTRVTHFIDVLLNRALANSQSELQDFSANPLCPRDRFS